MQVPPTIGGQNAWSRRGGGGVERRGDACVALVEHHKPGRSLFFSGGMERGRLRRPWWSSH
jgi:hypothetical protein